jgi:predicted nucleotidyltransferase
VTQIEILDTVRRYRTGKGSQYPIVRLGIFGSAARNRITDNSDVDVVVELAKPDLFMLIGIKQDLEELLHRPVDIVRYRQQMILN